MIAAALALACAAPSMAQERAYTPSQAAYLKSEIRKAQERFVDQAAAISGVAPAKIRAWVPTDGRDAPPKLRVVPALERERGKALSEDEKQRILAADQERFNAIERAKQDALKK